MTPVLELSRGSRVWSLFENDPEEGLPMGLARGLIHPTETYFSTFHALELTTDRVTEAYNEYSMMKQRLKIKRNADYAKLSKFHAKENISGNLV